MLDEIQQRQGEIIVFIDELHNVVGAGAAQGAMDASNMMKPALARGELRCIGATTLDEYRQYIEKDRALERRFAPGVSWTSRRSKRPIEMLQGPARALRGAPPGAHHRRGAGRPRAELSHRYVTDRSLPDKAIDLMDEAGGQAAHRACTRMPPELQAARTRAADARRRGGAGLGRRATTSGRRSSRAERLQLEKRASRRAASLAQASTSLDDVVDEEDIAEVVAHAGPASRSAACSKTEAERLLRMEEHLHERIIGQDEAIARRGRRHPPQPAPA